MKMAKSYKSGKQKQTFINEITLMKYEIKEKKYERNMGPKLSTEKSKKSNDTKNNPKANSKIWGQTRLDICQMTLLKL